MSQAFEQSQFDRWPSVAATVAVRRGPSAGPGRSRWRGRDMHYSEGSWEEVRARMPEFERLPFIAGTGGAPNPHLLTVARKPVAAGGPEIPVAVVSHSYALTSHQAVGELCLGALVGAGADRRELRYEIGLSELGEWMNLRFYFPDDYAFIDDQGHKLVLRLECFNSIDGSSRLSIAFGWYRLICANGLIVFKSKFDIKARHDRHLDLGLIARRVKLSMTAVQTDRRLAGLPDLSCGVETDLAGTESRPRQRNSD